jgi:hypothetical protein
MLNHHHKYILPAGFILFSALLVVMVQPAFSQGPDLNRKISVHYAGIPLEMVLKDLSHSAGILFSYSPGNIPVNFMIRYNAVNKPVGKVLEELFLQAGIRYTLVAGYLVLKKANEEILPEKPVRLALFTVSGIISDSSSREVLIGATVYIRETRSGAFSNSYGFFSITQPAGIYTLETSYLGFAIESRTITLDGNTTWNVYLQPNPYSVKEVIVSAAPGEDPGLDMPAGRTTLSARTIQRRAAALGETDMLKSMDQLPGISFQSDGSSYFFVRGGSHDQNLILLDESPIYNPTHLLGLFTPIIPEAVKHTEIYKADFPIQYGGRLSSVMDIRTRDGNMQRFSGSAGISPVSTRLSLEGPFKKDASSWFVSIRRSQFGFFVKKINPAVEDFYFTDFNAKCNIRLGKRDRLFLTLFSGKDVYKQKPSSVRNGLEWGNNSVTLRWNHLYGSRLFSNTTFYTSKYDYALYTDYDKKICWNSDITSSNLKSEFSWYCNPSLKLDAGMNLGAYFFNPGNYNMPGEISSTLKVSEVNSTELVLYAGIEQKITDWMGLHYGLRYSNWSNYGEAFSIGYDEAYNPVSYHEYAKGERYYSKSFPEPRVSVSFRTGPMAYIKASYNRTIQHINQINNSISPLNSLEVWLPSGPNIKPQSAHILDLGFQKAWPERSVDVSADVYYKKMDNQIGYSYHAEMLLNPFLEGELRQGEGEAYGVELMLRKTRGKISGQFGFAYARSFLTIKGLNNNRTYPSRQDRPLDFTLSVDYAPGPRLTLNVNAVYTSGMTVTTPTGFYYYRGRQVPVYTRQNNDRLPPYRRVDLGLSRRLNRKEQRFEHYLSVAIYNLLATKNYAFLNFSKIQGEDGNFYVPADTYTMDEQITTYRYMYSLIPSITYNLKF